MDGLIIIGVIIYGIYYMLGGNCDHDWVYYNDIHKCTKCKKSEKHTYELVERDAWADKDIDTYTVMECTVCGCNAAWDND